MFVFYLFVQVLENFFLLDCLSFLCEKLVIMVGVGVMFLMVIVLILGWVCCSVIVWLIGVKCCDG